MNAFGIEVDSAAVRIYRGGLSKHEALESLIDALSASDCIVDPRRFREAVHEREKVMSTGIGSGVAIPHVRIDEVRCPCVGVGVSRDGIDYDTLDNEPVHVLVLFAMPSGSQREYLALLAQVMTALKTPGFRDKLVACDTPDEVVAALHDFGE